MNNPYNLSPQQRAITPKPGFNTGINSAMHKKRRAAKQARSRENQRKRGMQGK
jgi:hypothetical protein